MDNFVTKNTFLEPKESCEDEDIAPSTRRFKTEPAPTMADAGALDDADSEEAESDTLPTLLSEAEALRHPQIIEEDVKPASEARELQVKNTFINYEPSGSDDETLPHHVKYQTEPVLQQDRSSSSSDQSYEDDDSLPSREARCNFKTRDPFEDKDDMPSHQNSRKNRCHVTHDEFEEDLALPPQYGTGQLRPQQQPSGLLRTLQVDVAQPTTDALQAPQASPAFLSLESALQPPMQGPPPPLGFCPMPPPLVPGLLPPPFMGMLHGAGLPQPDAQAGAVGAASYQPSQPTACPKGQRRPPRLWAHIYLHMVSDGFDLVPMLIGRDGCNVKRIASTTGAKVRIRGKGSGHKENDNKEAPVPLMIAVTVDKSSMEYFRKAVEMTVDELKRVAKRYAEHCAAKNIEHSGPFYSLNVAGEGAASCLHGIFEASEMVQAA